MQINWPWLVAAITIALLCLLAVWLPFWIGGMQ
jgi:hypothetical protein